MKERCYNAEFDRYKDYGARGIQICQEWLESFDNFADWAYENGYKTNLTIDRVNNDGNYEPSNCRWITLKEQTRNTRNTKWVLYRGQRKPLVVWCEELKLPYDAVHNRIEKGWTVEDAFEKPLFDKDNSWVKKCKKYGINPTTAKDRIVKFGWSEEEALNTPTLKRGMMHNKYADRHITEICPVCGKKFVKNTVRKKYCGSKCLGKSKTNSFKRGVL